MGTTQWNSIPIPLVAIENVEIVKSPGTLYGANALAGVINIVTRQPQERWLVEGKGLYGNGATHSEQVYLGLNTGQTKASFSGSQIASNIFSPKSTLAENQNASLFGNLMFSREWSTNQRSSLRFGFSQLKQVPQLVNPGAILMLGESKSWILDGEHEINFADQDPLKFSFTYRHYDVEHPAHLGMAEASASSGTFVGNLEKNLTLLQDRNRLLIGVEMTHKTSASSENDPVDAPVSQRSPGRSQKLLSMDVNARGWAMYLQDIHSLRENLKLYIGSRYDWHWCNYRVFSPYASLVWRPNVDTYWRFNSHWASRFPNLYELFGTFSFARTTESDETRKVTLSGGGEALKTEHVRALELGYGSRYAGRLTVDLNLFRYWIRRPVALTVNFREIFTEEGITHSLIDGIYENQQNITTQGGEAELSFVLYNWLQLRADMAYHALGESQSLMAHRATPRLIAHAGPELRWGFGTRMKLEWEHRGVSEWKVFADGDQRNRLEGVDLVNFSLESSWNTFLFGVRVDNVLDKKHFMFPQGLGSEIGRRLLFTAQNAF